MANLDKNCKAEERNTLTTTRKKTVSEIIPKIEQSRKYLEKLDKPSRLQRIGFRFPSLGIRRYNLHSTSGRVELSILELFFTVLLFVKAYKMENNVHIFI